MWWRQNVIVLRWNSKINIGETEMATKPLTLNFVAWTLDTLLLMRRFYDPLLMDQTWVLFFRSLRSFTLMKIKASECLFFVLIRPNALNSFHFVAFSINNMFGQLRTFWFSVTFSELRLISKHRSRDDDAEVVTGHNGHAEQLGDIGCTIHAIYNLMFTEKS